MLVNREMLITKLQARIAEQKATMAEKQAKGADIVIEHFLLLTNYHKRVCQSLAKVNTRRLKSLSAQAALRYVERFVEQVGDCPRLSSYDVKSEKDTTVIRLEQAIKELQLSTIIDIPLARDIKELL